MTSPRFTLRGNIGVSFALMAVAIALTASLVWLVRVRSQAVEAGYRIHTLRMQLVQLEQQRAALEVERASLMRPTRLALLARTELGLVPPSVQTTVSTSTTASTTPTTSTSTSTHVEAPR